MSKHRPGPWAKFRGNYGNISIVTGYLPGFVIANLPYPGEYSHPNFLAEHLSHKEAEASLIAAAPTLFEAAEKVLEQWESLVKPPIGNLADAIMDLANAVKYAKGEV
jgi:hypothetical protein